jgi:stage II sporulation protein M
MKKRKKDSTKKGNFLKKNYSQIWNYIKESKMFILIIVLLFFAFVLIGFALPISDELQKTILDYINKILEQTQGMSFFELTGFIFLNNLKSAFFGMMFGIFLGIFPVIVTLVNGYFLGYVSYLSVKAGGLISLLVLLPHGIFELTAIFISLGLGLKFGTAIFRKNPGKSFNDFFVNSMRVFVFVVLPLLIIAAVIEGCLIFLAD